MLRLCRKEIFIVSLFRGTLRRCIYDIIKIYYLKQGFAMLRRLRKEIFIVSLFRGTLRRCIYDIIRNLLKKKGYDI